jgi:Domain of unknown function (DUF5666)
MDEQGQHGYGTHERVPGTKRSAAVVATGAAVLLLIGAAGFAFAASPAPSTGTGASAAPSAPPAGAPKDGRGFGFGPGARGIARGILGHGPAFGAIHLTAIDGSKLSLATDDGWSRTITIGSATTLMRAGQTISAGDLKVGDEVRFAETKAADGTFTITKLEVILPTSAGQVTAKAADSLTIKRLDGTTQTIHLGSSTTYRTRGNASASLADVNVGSYVIAVGNARPDGSLDALEVLAGQPSAVQGRGALGQPFGPGKNRQNGAPDQNGASPSASASTSTG